MEVAVVIATLVMSFVCLAAGVYSVACYMDMLAKMSAHIANQMESVRAVEAIRNEIKTAMELVHKIHAERQGDLKPIIDRLQIVEMKASAAASNARRPGQ